MSHMAMDPFTNQPPCYTEAARAILNGIERAARQQDSVQHSVDCESNLHRVIGGTGQGQGAERKDKLTGAQREPVRAPNHYAVFCTHEIPYWRPCKKCGRSKSAAQKNIQIVLKSVGRAAFFTK